MNFNDLIFNAYGQNRGFFKIKHILLNVRDSMLSRHTCFAKMPLDRQFAYCDTIATIAIHSQLQHLNENRPISAPKKEYYKYSIDRDWKGDNDKPFKLNS